MPVLPWPSVCPPNGWQVPLLLWHASRLRLAGASARQLGSARRQAIVPLDCNAELRFIHGQAGYQRGLGSSGGRDLKRLALSMLNPRHFDRQLTPVMQPHGGRGVYKYINAGICAIRGCVERSLSVFKS